MANHKGGIVLIGVSDKGEIKGVQLGKETVRQWSNQITQVTEPRLTPSIVAEKINGKTVIAIQISEHKIKPVAVNGRGYLRANNSNRQLTLREISEFHLLSTGSSWDMQPASSANINDLSLKKVKEYMKLSMQEGRRNFTGNTPLEVLNKIQLTYNKKPTWASVLLFGKNSNRFLSQARVHCGRFKGTSTIIDDNYIGGDIISQVDETEKAIKKNINVRYEIKGKIKRDDVWDYPLDALREAVLNAICHRDYSDNSDIIIKIFDDYVSIWNPGGLPPGITMKQLFEPEHPSNPRNKLITQVFFDIGEIERHGSGIQRMINECKKAELPPPELKEIYGGFQVIFRKDIYTEGFMNEMGLSERQRELVLYIKESKRITNGAFQKKFKVSHRTAARELKFLLDKGILKKTGERGKGTAYSLKS